MLSVFFSYRTNEFNRFIQFEPSADFTIIQDRLISELIDQLAEDIFNRTFKY